MSSVEMAIHYYCLHLPARIELVSYSSWLPFSQTHIYAVFFILPKFITFLTFITSFLREKISRKIDLQIEKREVFRKLVPFFSYKLIYFFQY